MCRNGTYALPPLPCVQVRNVYPPAFTVRACSNVYPPSSTVRAFLERMPSRFRVHANRVVFGFLFILGTLVPEWLWLCAAIDRNSLLSFLLGEFVRERLVRVLAWDPTVPKKFYLVGTSICICITVIYFFPSGTSLRARTFVRNVGWGGHHSTTC